MTAALVEFWRNKRVCVTGHMGFKGAWLCSLLARLDASTWGFGRDARPELLYRELRLPEHRHHEGDIADTAAFRSVLQESRAEILFHLAAQSIVIESYADPLGTFDTNVMGVARVLEAARAAPHLKAVVVVTSDKVYRNREWEWGYRESDQLGGIDPYSASKSAAELIAESMARSFFERGRPVATARAGNVIGGGDWAANRLLPDAAKALRSGAPLKVRNPKSMRPWQHVLDPLAGYLALARWLIESGAADAFSAWNFGPPPEETLAVEEVAQRVVRAWGGGARWTLEEPAARSVYEAARLAVDSSRAQQLLGWRSKWTAAEAINLSTIWYRDHSRGIAAADLVERDIARFFSNG